MNGAHQGHKQSGVFISVEGGDGAGKSTQIKRLSETLLACGRDVIVTREPGGSEGAEAIRELLVKGDKDRWSPLSEALLMYAARRDHLEKTILPVLKRGGVVITDRFADSTMAYQGLAGELGVKNVEALHELVVGDCNPDLTLILDTSAAAGLKRADASTGETRFEEKGVAYQEKVRDAFLTIAKAAPERCAVIDATGTIDEVAASIEAVIQERIPGLIER
ncbi:MAG: thymidylate kinase [Hyphococcus sp.]|nr:MAG: thymidylate kinase [Marinicaulis sp.]